MATPDKDRTKGALGVWVAAFAFPLVWLLGAPGWALALAAPVAPSGRARIEPPVTGIGTSRSSLRA